jgi:hypothetical protein
MSRYQSNKVIFVDEFPSLFIYIYTGFNNFFKKLKLLQEVSLHTYLPSYPIEPLCAYLLT